MILLIHFLLAIYASIGFNFSSAYAASSDWDPSATPYPPAKRSDQTYVYNSALHGSVTVPDPYSYLEDLDSNETISFYTTQTAFTQQYLNKLPDLDYIRQSLKVTLNYEKYRPPIPAGKDANNITYYYRVNNGLDAGYTWYAASLDDLLKAEQDNYATLRGTKFFDENLLGPNATYIVEEFNFSPTGKFFAYSISYAGSDERTYCFRETSKPFVIASQNADENAKGGPDRLPDVLKSKYTDFQWTSDEKGGFYVYFPTEDAANQSQSDISVISSGQIYYHTMGTDQKDDILVMDEEKKFNLSSYGTFTTDDGQYLLVEIQLGVSPNASVYLAPLNQPVSSNMSWLSVTPDFSYSLSFLTNIGNDFYWITNANAPNRRLVRTRVDPSKARVVEFLTDLTDTLPLEEVVPERKDAFLTKWVVVLGDKALLTYTKDANSELYQYELKTGIKLRRLLPDLLGQISDVSGSLFSDQAFVMVQSLTVSSTAYRLAWIPRQARIPRATPNVIKHRSAKIKGLDLSAFVTKQVFVPSTDNVTVPVYIVYRNDTLLDGTAASYMKFYGAYGDSLLPSFDPDLIWFLNAYGAVLLWVNARGGSEKGGQWWSDGQLLKKKNTFIDIIAAAQYAADNKYVAKGKIIANGRSAGGLAALAVGNMAPEGLLGIVFADVPVADMLRLGQFTVGLANTAEFGSPFNSGEMFDYIYSYSPLHNVNASKAYQMTVCSTADHDDRVPPLHSYKMTAQLQYSLPNNPNPLLLRVNSASGHSLTSSADQKVEEDATKHAIAAYHLGLQRKSST